jgi:hypothetical protein
MADSLHPENIGNNFLQNVGYNKTHTDQIPEDGILSVESEFWLTEFVEKL